LIVSLRCLRLATAEVGEHRRNCWPISSMPGGVMMSTPTLVAASSISRSSSSPLRSMRRNLAVASSAAARLGTDVHGLVARSRTKPNRCRAGARGSSASRMRSSARLGLHAHALLGLLAVHLHRGIGQVADDLFHVLADVAHSVKRWPRP
jgi:hypothetical protein